MKKFRFLLLDAGPILELFKLGLWEEFIARCDVTICRTVAEEAKWASGESEDICIDLEAQAQDNRIRIADVLLPRVKVFHDKFSLSYKTLLHDGEKETLAFLHDSPQEWLICTADGGVFRTLGVLGRGTQGVSLEKVLVDIGLGHQLEWRFTERFRQKYTSLGQADGIQGIGIIG